jgi:hypothetical protein
MLSPSEIKKRAIEFAREYESDADEKSQAQNFWRDFFAVWGLSPQRGLKVENCAQAVLDARAEFPDSSLADLYDPLTMPAALAKAHRDLDAAVDKCYRKEPFRSELERVEFLFGLYERYTAALTAGAGAIRKRIRG